MLSYDWRNPERVVPWKPRHRFAVTDAGQQALARYRDAVKGAQGSVDPRSELERAKQLWADALKLRPHDGIILDEFIAGRVILATFSIVTANGGQGDGGSESASSGGDSGGGDDSGGRGDSGSSSSGSDDAGPGDSGKNGSGKDDSGRGNEAEVTATGTVTPDETQTTGPAETKGGENDDTCKGDVTNIQVKIKEETSEKHTDVTVLKVKITEREAEIEQELHVAGVKDQEILRKQSSILVGVQALREVNELVSVNAANITRPSRMGMRTCNSRSIGGAASDTAAERMI